MTAPVARAAKSALPRGIRNNNPFNIRHNPANTWEGMAAAQTDPDFVQFVDIVYGIRAGVRIFRNYAKFYGARTVQQLIARHAPATENPTDAFVRFVCARLAVGPNDPVDLNDEATLVRLADAVIRFENGGYQVAPDVIRRGVRLALRPRTVAAVAGTDTGRGSLAATLPTAVAGSVATVAPNLWGLDWRVAVTIVVAVAVAAVVAVFVWRARRE